MKKICLLLALLVLAASVSYAQNTYAGGVKGSVTANCVPKSNGPGSIATTVICSDGTTTSVGANKVLITEANGNTTIAGTLAVTGAATFSGGIGNTGAFTVTSPSANALAVGLAGATNPAFNVDASTTSQAAGLNVIGAATGGTVAIVTIDSGSATNLTVNAKGTGTIGIGSVSTGAVTITPATNITGALTVTASINGPTSAARLTASTLILTAAQGGRLVVVANASDAVTTITLPAASVGGLTYCFAADNVTGSNREIDVEPPTGSDLIIGTTTAAGGTGIATTAGAGHGIKNTHATAVRGNSVCIQSDGVNSWYMRSLSGTWAAY